MALSTLTMILNLSIPTLAFFTNLPALTLLAKLVFQRGSIDILLKQVLPFYASLIFLSITGHMLSQLQLTL